MYFEKDSIVLLPKPTKKEVSNGTTTFNKMDQSYIGFLNIAMSDCKVNDNQISYDEDRLINLIKSYNECKETSSEEIKKNIPKNRITWSLFTGLDRANTKFDADINYYEYHISASNFRINSSLSVPVGLGLEWSKPSQNDKRYVGLEMWYDKKFFQSYAETSDNGKTLRSDLLMNVSYLKVPIFIRFNMRQEKNTPYLRFGYTHYFLMSYTSKFRDETETNGIVFTTVSVNQLEKKAANGFWMGAGYSYQLFQKMAGFLEVRYEINDGFTCPVPSSHSYGNSANLLIGLKF